MKAVAVFTLFALPYSANAIEFINEDQVAAKIGAEKAIEVSTQSISPLIGATNLCDGKIYSRSARAYVVKTAQGSFLYATPSGLAGLTYCREL